MRCNTDLETWLHDFEDDVFRILVYRKPGQYTQYEIGKDAKVVIHTDDKSMENKFKEDVDLWIVKKG